METVLWIVMGIGLYIYVVCLIGMWLRRNRRRYPLLRDRREPLKPPSSRPRERAGVGGRRRDDHD